MINLRKIIGCLLSLIIMFSSFAVIVNADNKGSVSVEFLYNGKSVSGINTQIVKIGNIEENILINFENAEKYYKYVKDNNITGVSKSSDNIGKAFFENVESGYYLVFYNDSGKYIIKPAIIKVVDNENAMAKPKMEYKGGGNSGGDTNRNIYVRKLWNDDDNKNGDRPSKIQVKLMYDGNIYKTAELNIENGFKHTFEDVPASSSFTVVEEDIKDYKAEYNYENSGVVIVNRAEKNDNNNPDNNNNIDNNDPDNKNDNINDNTDTTTDKINIPIKKEWIGNGEHSSVKVNLIKEYSIIDSCVLSDENNWSYVFKDKPKYDNYTIWEEEIDGWIPVYEKNENGEFIIKNYSPEKYNEIVSEITTEDMGLQASPQKPANEPKNEKIPQTGMLMWLVPVLMVLGVLFIICGCLIRGKKSEK